MNASIPNPGDRLIHDAVHEFNTPLTVIREFASILSEGLCAPGVVTSEECTQAILGASDDLLDMIDSFQGVAGIRLEGRRADRSGCALASIWEEILPGLAERATAKRIRLDAEIDADSAPLDVDRRQVARALRGVVRAAIRSTPAGGLVRCWGRARSTAHLAIGCLDGGPELSREDLLLFERGEVGQGLERRSRICTFGLELELARVVAIENGGRIRLRPGPGGGRACLLVLPVVRAETGGGGRRSLRRRSKSLGRTR